MPEGTSPSIKEGSPCGSIIHPGEWGGDLHSYSPDPDGLEPVVGQQSRHDASALEAVAPAPSIDAMAALQWQADALSAKVAGQVRRGTNTELAGGVRVNCVLPRAVPDKIQPHSQGGPKNCFYRLCGGVANGKIQRISPQYLEEVNERAYNYIRIEEAKRRAEKGHGKRPMEDNRWRSPEPEKRSALDRIWAPDRAYSRDDLPNRKVCLLTPPGRLEEAEGVQGGENRVLNPPEYLGRESIPGDRGQEDVAEPARQKMPQNKKDMNPTSSHTIGRVYGGCGEPTGHEEPHGNNGQASSTGHEDGGVHYRGHIKVQMEIGSTSGKTEESGDRNMCTSQVPGESPKKGKPHEEIRSVPFDEKEPAKVFRISTTLGAEHKAMLIRVIREYRVMAFGLKNAGAMYHQMVNKVFSTQIGQNMEIYVDDMLIKSWEAGDHEANL
ncbi:hypothetical protein LIER_14095 [Lithospermum erythrorhizon]|uniref:Reverse transcriptase domain-containing protein n=1 Tax=Lithospermum erythrorhizon TaxID=34254 RepID=A0AAV3Q122_LITER